MISFHSERNAIKVSVDQIHFVVYRMICLKICQKLFNDNNDSGDSDDCSVHLTVTPDKKNYCTMLCRQDWHVYISIF